MSKRENIAHTTVVESLTEALLQLAAQKPLTDVNVSELCARAGVSRVSFYRNFDSTQDILVKHLTSVMDRWWSTYSLQTPDALLRGFWPALLELYRGQRRLLMLLYGNDLAHLLKKQIFDCCEVRNTEDTGESYARAALAGALYGLVDEWIRRGMGEFPQGFSLQNLADYLPEEQ